MQIPQTPQTPTIISTNEEEEEEEIILSDQWQQQVDAEASIASTQQAIANMQRSLDAAYNNYHNTLDQHQRGVFNRVLHDQHANGYFHHVGRYYERRRRDRTWRDDHPYTRHL